MSSDVGMFYGWQAWEKTGNPANHNRGDNPPFATNHYSMPPGGRKLLKGYMRSSLPEKYGKARFHFQYNPNTISRSTTVNQDLLGLANQTTADLMALSAMPGAGAGFSFSLILDRQDEVSMERFSNEAYAFSATPEDPRTGVDVDIRVLDKIAGIGQYSVALDSIATGTSITDFISGGAAGIFDRVEAAQAAGDGNQAFMASMQPIRVVFSKNFMVEGYISALDVTYTKFSRNMVPVMATVQVAMQAFFIGQARATTWWSDQVASGTLTNNSSSATTSTTTAAPAPPLVVNPSTGAVSGGSGSSGGITQNYGVDTTPIRNALRSGIRRTVNSTQPSRAF